MELLAVIILICSLASCTDAIKCFECANNENNCNSGDCEGDWCVARYITKNPFASDHEQRVTKSCETTHPTGFSNDSCVESISPSGRKLACGCRTDYCNDDKAIQKLPVESHDDGGPILVNVTTPIPETSTEASSGGDLVNHTNVQTTGALKCRCDEDEYCVKNECRGGACTTEIFDETGLTSVGGGVRIGARISKGCAAFIPTDVRDKQIKRPTTVTLPNGKKVNTEVTILYCNEGDYCNKAIQGHSVLSLSILLVTFGFLFITA